MCYDRLSEPQQRTLNAIKNFIREHGFPPSVRDIAGLCGWKSWSSAQLYLDQLEDLGYISRSKRRGRTIRLIEQRQGDDSVAEAESR